MAVLELQPRTFALPPPKHAVNRSNYQTPKHFWIEKTSNLLRMAATNHVDSKRELEWVQVNVSSYIEQARPVKPRPETMQQRIIRITADETDLRRFHKVELVQPDRLRNYYMEELDSLEKACFEDYEQEDRVDYLLLRNYLQRIIRRLDMDSERLVKMKPLLSFTPQLIKLIEARQSADTHLLTPQKVAQDMHDATGEVKQTERAITQGELRIDKTSAFRAARAIRQLQGHLQEFVNFFKTYVPLFDWWVTKPYQVLDASLESYAATIETNLAGAHPDRPDEIIGDPIGRDGLLVELEAEMIPYTPEELLAAARDKYAWCIQQMQKAAAELGEGEDWRAALEHVKKQHVDPGQQAALVKQLVEDGAAYVRQHDLVTVPPLCADTWRMFMMTPAAQRVNPFFLGGPSVIVSYPTADMSHADKLMGMRGNNRHFAKATAFHEMIPGHRLSLFAGARHRPYRRLFTTPFYTEGWAMYWELVFWDRGDFFDSPEDRIGTLFWRMHRCARILFSLGFHMGQLTPSQCVDLLVDMVGHERATAEGEVRRSLNGDYSPLYQAGYMLGALQLHALRSEVLETGLYREKEFHDRVLEANEMPIELLRALLLGSELSPEYKSQWRFLG